MPASRRVARGDFWGMCGGILVLKEASQNRGCLGKSSWKSRSVHLEMVSVHWKQEDLDSEILRNAGLESQECLGPAKVIAVNQHQKANNQGANKKSVLKWAALEKGVDHHCLIAVNVTIQQTYSKSSFVLHLTKYINIFGKNLHSLFLGDINKNASIQQINHGTFPVCNRRLCHSVHSPASEHLKGKREITELQNCLRSY